MPPDDHQSAASSRCRNLRMPSVRRTCPTGSIPACSNRCRSTPAARASSGCDADQALSVGLCFAVDGTWTDRHVDEADFQRLTDLALGEASCSRKTSGLKLHWSLAFRRTFGEMLSGRAVLLLSSRYEIVSPVPTQCPRARESDGALSGQADLRAVKLLARSEKRSRNKCQRRVRCLLTALATWISQ